MKFNCSEAGPFRGGSGYSAWRQMASLQRLCCRLAPHKKGSTLEMASTVPAQPKIYHIVHVENVGRIAAEGWLMADAKIASRSGVQGIGLPRIKRRRRELPVSCHRGLFVGDCVPFYFCPRSIMLFVIHCGN